MKNATLGMGCCTLPAVTRSNQPSTRHGMVKWISAVGLSNNNKWRWWMRMVADSYQRTHSPSWLAWSECWRPPGVQSAFIKRTRWTLAVALSQYDSSTINIVLYIILSYYMSLTACLYNVRIESTVIGIYWFIYEKCKSQWLQHTGNDTLHFLQAFSSGALAGSVSCTCVCGFTVWLYCVACSDVICNLRTCKERIRITRFIPGRWHTFCWHLPAKFNRMQLQAWIICVYIVVVYVVGLRCWQCCRKLEFPLIRATR